MGLIRGVEAIGTLGRAARGLGEVFVPNATEGQRLEHGAHRAALDQLAAEFALDRRGPFDRFMDGLNRLPRPMLALGTLGLFVYAMAEPAGFAARMQGLGHVPEPLWWLLGAIVGFYFGARELHYVRRPGAPAAHPKPRMSAWHAEAGPLAEDGAGADNPALSDWRGGAN